MLLGKLKLGIIFLEERELLGMLDLGFVEVLSLGRLRFGRRDLIDGFECFTHVEFGLFAKIPLLDRSKIPHHAGIYLSFLATTVTGWLLTFKIPV